MKTLLVFLCLFPFSLFSKEAESGKLRLHFISGAKEYQSAESLKKLQAHLEKNHQVTITGS